MIRLFAILSAAALSMGPQSSAGATAAAPPPPPDGGREIRVGLLYDEGAARTATPSFTLDSAGGLDVALGSGQGSERVGPVAGFGEPVTVRKDAYFVYEGGRYRESTSGAALSKGPDGYGPFHIRLSAAAYADYAQARKESDALNAAMGIGSYVAYHNSAYHVWAGSYVSMHSASKDAESLGYPGADVISGSKDVVIVHSGREIVFAASASTRALTFEPADGASPIRLNSGASYRGAIGALRLAASDMTVINVLGLEGYLYGCVPAEIGPGAHIEAQKAQAVAARTYAMNCYGKHSITGFDICSTVHCQVYKGKDAEAPLSTQAVDSTKGQAVLYAGSLAHVFYFSSSGGHTLDVSSVWGTDYPYLKGVPDPYESGDSYNYRWSVSITPERVRQMVRDATGKDVGEVVSVSVSRRTRAGSVEEMSVVGRIDVAILSKERCRTVFGLSSLRFDVAHSSGAMLIGAGGVAVPLGGNVGGVMGSAGDVRQVGDQLRVLRSDGSVANVASGSGAGGSGGAAAPSQPAYVFTGTGWGHGVGMSQEGAKGLAERGYGYREILAHYFPGTVVA